MKKLFSLPLAVVFAAACSESTAPVATKTFEGGINAVAIAGGTTYTFEGISSSDASIFNPYSVGTITTPYTVSGFSSGSGYLGRFTNNILTFSVNYTAGASLYYDLYIIGTWDGTARNYGPDQWQLSAYCGSSATGTPAATFTTTFSNKFKGKQNYPNQITGAEVAGTTGSLAVGVLGFGDGSSTRTTNHSVSVYDAIYRMSAAFPSCTTSEVTFKMLSPTQQLQAAFDEGWGIDNVYTSSAAAAGGYNNLF